MRSRDTRERWIGASPRTARTETGRRLSGISKALAARRALDEHARPRVLASGDDETDERCSRALLDSTVRVAVGSAVRSAVFHLEDHSAARPYFTGSLRSEMLTLSQAKDGLEPFF